MKILLTTLFAFLVFSSSMAQDTWQKVSSTGSGTLTVHYFENRPFVFQGEDGQLTGLEADLLVAFTKWLKETRKIDLKLDFKGYKDFNEFYNSIKTGGNGLLGAGSVTITRDRSKEIKFTPPYLRNISVLISGLNIPTLVGFSDIHTKLDGMTACVIKGSVAEKELLEIKKFHFPAMVVKYVQKPEDITEYVARDPKKFFGYSDLISYWLYTKTNGGRLKMHRNASRENEKFGFILPTSSDWQPILAEFFEGGFGFTANILYKEILERHLGYEVIKSVELN